MGLQAYSTYFRQYLRRENNSMERYVDTRLTLKRGVTMRHAVQTLHSL